MEDGLSGWIASEGAIVSISTSRSTPQFGNQLACFTCITHIDPYHEAATTYRLSWTTLDRNAFHPPCLYRRLMNESMRRIPMNG